MDSVNLELLRSFRHQLHQFPEVSGKEYATALRIKEFLKLHAKGKCIPLTETGFMWVMEGDLPGPTITIRSELDALPIQEINSFDHRSVHEGVSHKCGHDGHAVILCGTILQMSTNWPMNGTYQFLFQPAEENGEGAKAILSSNLHQFASDYIFALHNLPGYPLHCVVCKSGTFTAAVRSIIVKLSGKTSHAAEPEHGINPALAIAEILQRSVALQHNDVSSEDFCVVVPIHMHMGEISYGISAGYGEVRLTMRAWTDEKLSALAASVVEIVEGTAARYGLAVAIDWAEFFSANVNDEVAATMVERAAHSLGLDFQCREAPFKWGEDFGLFTQQFRGAMFGLGAGLDTPALHNPDYDFPDELIATGIAMFSRLLQDANA